jgi:photosystem II stability/assembly factor-like uncharacterized protein
MSVLHTGERPSSSWPGIWRIQRLSTPLKDATFVDTFNGWSQDGTRRTIDGGQTWSTARLKPAEFVSFATPLVGWAAGTEWLWDRSSAYIETTADGGLTWTRQYTSRPEKPAESWNYLHFADTLYGWAHGTDGPLQTTDGGKTWTAWTTFPSGPPQSLNIVSRKIWYWTIDVDFTTDGVPIRRMYKTTDGGLTTIEGGLLPVWASGEMPDVASDRKTIIVAGSDGRIARSTDFGATWADIASPTTTRLHMPLFGDDNNGWVYGGKTVFRTLDGGRTWSKQITSNTGDIANLIALQWDQAFFSAERIYRTRNAGSNWYALPYSAGRSWQGIRDLAIGASGETYGAGYEFTTKSTNGGRSWTDLSIPSSRLDVVGSDYVWAAGDHALYRSRDGGKTWLTSSAMQQVDFINPDEGWGIRRNSIYKSSDGGTSWREVLNGSNNEYAQAEFLDVFILDALRGWVLASEPAQYYGSHAFAVLTTDGGETWQRGESAMWGGAFGFQGRLHFISQSDGWLAGYRKEESTACSVLSRTTDGGHTWQPSGPQNCSAYPGLDFEGYRDLDFEGANGWVVRNNGAILHTADGGISWNEFHYTPAADLWSVEISGPDAAYVGGEGGLILRWDAQASACMVTPTPPVRTTATPIPQGTVKVAVRNCVDDAHERADNVAVDYTDSSVLVGRSLGGGQTQSTYTGGLLFRDVQVRRYSKITSARLKIFAKNIGSVPLALTITGERRDTAGDFTEPHAPISARTRTTAAVSWTITNKTSGWLEGPDLSPIIEEIVKRGDWMPGNDIALLVEAASGTTDAVSWGSFDWDPNFTAQLEIAYQRESTATPTSTPSLTPSTTPTPTSTLTPSATPTYSPDATGIVGYAWLDLDGDGLREEGEPGILQATVRLFVGANQVGELKTLGDGSYAFPRLSAGQTYRVVEVQPYWLPFSSTPNEQTITLAEGQTVEVNFGDWYGRSVYLPLLLR